MESNSAISYTVTPINQQCQNSTNIKVVSNLGTSTNSTNNELDTVLQQAKLDAQYDSTSITVKKIYGGNSNNTINKKNNQIKNKTKLIIYNNFKIKFKKKVYNIQSNNEINAMKLFLNDRIYKGDNIITVNESVYILRANYKNKFVKISD